MSVIWSDFASDNLKDVFFYYKEVAGENIAHKLREKIFATTKQLEDQPFSGQIELTLEHLKEGHRYLVVGNYKIVYKVVKEDILITDLFDTRQEPVKINDLKRRPRR